MLLDRRSGNADGASSTPRVVFFDLGNVVMPWSPRRLYAELMPDATVVVSHGGHTTAMRALAHDLPVLVLPLDPTLDHAISTQPDLARRIGQRQRTPKP